MNKEKIQNKLFLLPKCICNEGYEGNFCEKQKSGLCVLSKQEKEAGVEKCMNGGLCYINEERQPKCK